MKHLLKNVTWFGKPGSGWGALESRCGIVLAGRVEHDTTMTSLVNLCTCYACLEAVLKHSHSQIVLDQYIALEKEAGEAL